jgi:hypothetical protein
MGRRGLYDNQARSPDVTPCESFHWGYLKDIVFKHPPATIIELQERIEQACEQIPEEISAKHVALFYNALMVVCIMKDSFGNQEFRPKDFSARNFDPM